MQKVWSDLAWEQLQDWSARDRKTLKRIYSLIQSIDRNGYSAIGKPEPLKNNLSGWWSVRIDAANRLIFRLYSKVSGKPTFRTGGSGVRRLTNRASVKAGCKHANDRPLWPFEGPGAVFTCSQPCAAGEFRPRCKQAA